MKKLNAESLKGLVDFMLIDTRPANEFADGFVAGSLYLAPDKFFGPLSQLFLQPAATVVLVSNTAPNPEVTGQLEGDGFTIAGYITYPEAIAGGGKRDMVITVDPYELAIDLPNDDRLLAVDVRTAAEYDQQHLGDARHLALADFNDMAQIAALPETANIYVYCSNGNRSATACSLLRRQGIANIRWVSGGLEAMTSQDGLPIVRSAANLN